MCTLAGVGFWLCREGVSRKVGWGRERGCELGRLRGEAAVATVARSGGRVPGPSFLTLTVNDLQGYAPSRHHLEWPILVGRGC